MKITLTTKEVTTVYELSSQAIRDIGIIKPDAVFDDLPSFLDGLKIDGYTRDGDNWVLEVPEESFLEIIDIFKSHLPKFIGFGKMIAGALQMVKYALKDFVGELSDAGEKARAVITERAKIANGTAPEQSTVKNVVELPTKPPVEEK